MRSRAQVSNGQRDEMNIETTIKDIAQKHGVHCSYINVTDRPYKRVSFDIEALPVLPFFADLALAFDVPLENIAVDHMHGGSGCDTCGYGSECDFDVEIRLGVGKSDE
jgi:hypothetical protein